MVNPVLVLGRVVRSRAGRLDAEALAGAAFRVRQRGGWWAGLLDGGSPEGAAAGLRPYDVGVVVTDPGGRVVAWVDAVFAIDLRAEPGAVAGVLVPGCGGLWRAGSGRAQASARAWRALRRAHARVLVERSCGLPPLMWRQASRHDPGAVRRAVRAWLAGEEELAARIVHSAVAARLALGEAGYSPRPASSP